MRIEDAHGEATAASAAWWPIGSAHRELGWWLDLLLVVVVAALWAFVATAGALPGDAATAEAIRANPAGPVLSGVAHALDWLGRFPVAAAVTAVVAIVAWRVAGPRYGVLAVACLGASGVTAIIKLLVHRPRPSAGRYLDYSFPSGHTTFAAAVLGFATVFALQQRRYPVAGACALIVAAMGPSRVLLGVHWVSDVAAGYAVGFAWLILVLLVGLPKRTRDRLGTLRNSSG